ncbi:hypothetical protein BDV96DRAFT_560760, partial [Lophiotrema nucula]
RTPNPKFSCTTPTDCGIVAGQNRYGYIPVCARKDATFTREEACPHGGVGVCGFEEPEGCGCDVLKGVCAEGVVG